MGKTNLTKSEAWVYFALKKDVKSTISKMVEKHIDSKGWKYQTYQTYLEKLREKGLVDRKKELGEFVYFVTDDESYTLEDIFEKYFGKDIHSWSEQLVSFLTNVKKLSKREEKIIRDILEEPDDDN